jgi:hypothetical protein
VCLSFGAVLSASRIESMTGRKGPSFGFSGLCSVHTRWAPNSDTSLHPSPDSIQKPAPPPADSSPQQKQIVEPLRRSPPQTSPAALRIKVRKSSALKVARFYSATQQQYAAASWPSIAPPRTSYNEERPHQGLWCFGKTPLQTFFDTIPIAREKMIAA